MSRDQTFGASQPLVLEEQTVGSLLRTSRMARGERLDDVADVLRIRRHYLEAIEADRLEALPRLVYAVGYVKSYAKHLGLSSELVADHFRRRFEATRALGPGEQDAWAPPTPAPPPVRARLFGRWFA